MGSSVQMNATFNIRWTVPNVLTIKANPGDCLESPYYKTACDTEHEAIWKFLLYPRGRLNSVNGEEIEITTVVKSRNESYSDPFLLYILGRDERKEFLGTLTQKDSTCSVSRTFIESNSEALLVNDSLEILCTTSACDLPYYWNMKSKILLCKHLRNLRKSGEDCDVTIIVRGGNDEVLKEFKAHKAILCARSEFFDAMFTHNTLEKQNNCINLKEVNINALQAILDYFYYAEYDFKDEKQAMEICILADRYCVSDLKNACARFLCLHLSIDNLKMFLDFSMTYNINELFSAAVEYYSKHRAEIADEELVSFFNDLSSHKDTVDI